MILGKEPMIKAGILIVKIYGEEKYRAQYAHN